MDETATVFGVNPTHLYHPINSGGRAAAAESDERSRFTTNIGLGADGSLLPASFIIKCSTEVDDQSHIRVLDSLLGESTFNLDGLWEKGWWSRTMEVLKKVSIACCCMYVSFIP